MEEKIYSAAERTEKYKIILLDHWNYIKQLKVHVRTLYLGIAPLMEREKPENIQISDEDRGLINELLSNLIEMWEELNPKMKGKDAIGDKFRTFENGNKEPTTYIDDMQTIFDLANVLRESLEILGITKFEKEAG